jgi:hypothetical protein
LVFKYPEALASGWGIAAERREVCDDVTDNGDDVGRRLWMDGNDWTPAEEKKINLFAGGLDAQNRMRCKTDKTLRSLNSAYVRMWFTQKPLCRINEMGWGGIFVEMSARSPGTTRIRLRFSSATVSRADENASWIRRSASLSSSALTRQNTREWGKKARVCERRNGPRNPVAPVNRIPSNKLEEEEEEEEGREGEGEGEEEEAT